MTMSLQTIQRTAVRSWLSAVRLPLTAAERVVGKQGAQWPPAMAFEGFEAGVKRSVGNLLGDSQLAQEGSLESGKVAQLRRAAELEAKAEGRRQDAEVRFEDRKESVQERSRRLEREQEQREEKLAQDEADRKKAVEAAARKKEEAARKADQVRQEAVAAKERQARATRISAEAEALDHERAAVAAKGDVLEVDRALNATKVARKRS